MRAHEPTDVELAHHGDAELAPGLVDLAVNVRAGSPPGWLRERLVGTVDRLAAYPDGAVARAAVARHHGRPEEEVLLTAGAAEAFALLARAAHPRRAAVVHPQFTEPERLLRAAGHRVDRVLLRWPFGLDPELVPDDADLVVLGNPTNPTSVLHPRDVVSALARPRRLLVVDEAFMDAVPGEPESLAGDRDLPGLVVVRSLTKTWGLAGLRVGYVLGDPDLLARLAGAQPPWPVSTPALAAAEACTSARAAGDLHAWQARLAGDRERLLALLRHLPVQTVPDPRAPFLLLRVPAGARVRADLRRRGFAVRRGDTFPGLGADWLRVAVRDPYTSAGFVRALQAAVHGGDG